jgi:hypothetical protein
MAGRAYQLKMPHRDPETGQFTGEQHKVATDGGAVPADVAQHAYRGAGCYTDIEAVYWNYQANFSEDTQESDQSEQIIDFSDFLDRREEMADLLFLTDTLMIMETGDSQLASNPQQALATATIHSNNPGNTPLETQQTNFQLPGGDNDFIDVTDSADSIGKLLTVGTYGSYEDASNSAGGSGGGQAIDEDRIYGWQLSDPSFAERDELSVDLEYESSGDTSEVATVAGRAVFGVYELEEPAVSPCDD